MKRMLDCRLLKLLFPAPLILYASEAAGGSAASDEEEIIWSPSVYLSMAASGDVMITAHRSEMGTGVRTGLPMVVADELGADWSRVKVVQAPGDKKYGSQDTDGSRSGRDFFDVMRKAGASARLMLQRAAADKWGIAPAQCRVDRHQVENTATGDRLGFEALMVAASRQQVPEDTELTFKTPDTFAYVGKGVPLADISDICTGKAVYGIDARLPGMVFASIERPPTLGGTVASYDDTETLKVPGVSETVVLSSPKPPYGFKSLGGVAVIADSTWAAMAGREKLAIEWAPGPDADFDSDAYRDQLLEAAGKPQKVVRAVGNVDEGFTGTTETHEADYHVPMLAHATMEPPAAIAHVTDDRAEIWAPTQNPQNVQTTLAAVLKMPPENIDCHVTLLGGGFGRKSKPDFVVEAARLSRLLKKPVQVTWTREDDIRFDYYNAEAGMYLKAGLDENGRVGTLLMRSVFPPIPSLFIEGEVYGNAALLGQGWTDLPFDIQNIRAENGPAATSLRIGWLRSVANIYHAFAVQSFVDELAAISGKDPVDYFLDLLGADRVIDYAAEGTENANYGASADTYPWETGRLREVIEMAAEKSGWYDRKPQEGQALGFAAHRSFLTYVAAVVDVRVDDKGNITIPRVDVALDAGRVIHPDMVRAQFEGAAVFGASLALFGEITAKKSRIQQSNFHDYPIAKMAQAPFETRVHIVESSAPPAGVGEPGVPPIAPAICNAVYAITGKRIRRLPIKDALKTG